MKPSQSLPKFSVGEFMKNVGSGIIEKGRAGREETIDKERKEAARRKKRDDETAFWTTPGLRPLAEPPILDWDYFFREIIPSDLRYKALFPNDPEKRAMAKDLLGERAVLAEHHSYAKQTRDDPATDERRRDFYQKLNDVTYQDYLEVREEFAEVQKKATELSRFEFKWLDNDGRTTLIEQWIRRGAGLVTARGDDVRQKYSRLVPDGFVEDRLATFECYCSNLDGETSTIRVFMEHGDDLLVGWPQEVQDKYGHLRSWLPPEYQPHNNQEGLNEDELYDKDNAAEDQNPSALKDTS